MGNILKEGLDGLKEKYRPSARFGDGLDPGMEIVKAKKARRRTWFWSSSRAQRNRDFSSGKGTLRQCHPDHPPLTVEKGEIDHALQILDRAFQKTQAFHAA